MRISKFIKWLLVGVAVITLTACGGGSSDDTSEPTATALVKQTGQTESYTTSDDGYYQKGVEPSYTRDDSENIVQDHVTGLLWQDDEAVATVTKLWLFDDEGESGEAWYDCDSGDTAACHDTSGDTAATYCSSLTLGGYSDWRLPTIEELESIINRDGNTPHRLYVDPVFINIVERSYWSSTSKIELQEAWYMGFGDGSSGYDYKNTEQHVICVRDE